MEHSIKILQDELNKLNSIYEKFVSNGSVEITSIIALDNRKKARDLQQAIAELNHALQLQQTGVSGCYIERICDNCNTGYITELYRDSDGKQAIVTFQDCPNCGKRDDVWVKIHADNNQ